MDNKQNNGKLSIINILLIAGLFSAISAVLAGCASENISTHNKTWQPLFNGLDLTGWSVKCKPADKDKHFWKVENETIIADSMGNADHDYVWLVTDSEYSDFVLRLRFCAFRDSPGNSGVQIRSRYDDQAGWLDGPQIDINPPGPWRTGMIWDETRGVNRWLYPEVPKGEWVDKSMANPNLAFYYSDEGPGYNDLEITAIGTKVTVVLNGVTITEYNGEGVLNDQTHQARNAGQTGHIALQIHTKDQLKISFKDIYIKDLSR
ncbi:MAG TPA: DUF1080 domain-containing protein [Sedimentisphaerales bacterium]|nr:DUF1080 domain-containing protein [Sedimentisphaerales bacterium]